MWTENNLEKWDSSYGNALALVLSHPLFTPFHSFRTPCHSFITGFLSFICYNPSSLIYDPFSIIFLLFVFCRTLPSPLQQQPNDAYAGPLSRSDVADAWPRLPSSLLDMVSHIIVKRTISITGAIAKLGRNPKRRSAALARLWLCASRAVLVFVRSADVGTRQPLLLSPPSWWDIESVNRIPPHSPTLLATSCMALTNGLTPTGFCENERLMLTYKKKNYAV